MQNPLISVQSDSSARETANALAKLIEQNGLRVFARIDHASNAADVGMTLRPTELLIFGNPKGGTPLMQDQQTAGLDLPLKALVWEDDQGRVWLSYDDPDHLGERHGLGASSAPVTAAMKAGMSKLASAACNRKHRS